MKTLKCFFVLLTCITAISKSYCQQTVPGKLAADYSTLYPTEKIYFHFDKEVYLPGETIWFKAYLYGDGEPSKQSTNLYAALYNSSGQQIQKQLCPIFGGSATGSFKLPDTVKGSAVYCRAYTTWMLNFDEDFLFTKTIKIISADTVAANEATKNNVTLQFFAEGGDVVEGLSNTIAFKAADSRGLPYNVSGVIKNLKTGEVVQNFTAQHNGMGRFDMIAEAGNAYNAEWTDAAGVLQKTALPAAKAAGLSLKAVQQGERIIYNLTSNLAADSVYISLYQHQQSLYTKSIYLQPDLPVTEMVSIKDLPAGVVQLTVFAASGQPLAERVVFVNNHLAIQPVTMQVKESSLQKRTKNLLEITAADTIPANMSLSITDADMSPAGSSTIESSLLLSGDVKGYIHNPAYYFSSAKDAAANLDLVMLTHGWRRYNWVAMQNGVQPVIKYPADNYLQLQGQIGKSILKQLDKDEQVKVVIKTKDSTQNFYMFSPDNTGLLKNEGLVFYDTASVFYSFKKNKAASQQITFGSANYTYAVPKQLTIAEWYNTALQNGTIAAADAAIYKYHNNKQPLTKEKTLEGIVVKSGGWRNWKNNPVIKLEEKYASGAFRGGAASDGLDVLHDETAWTKGDIYNYINGKIPAITVSSSGGQKSLVSADAVSGSFATSARPMILFVDESEVDNYQLSLINIENVAYIKYIPRYPLVQGLPPALSIYLKKGDDAKNVRRADSDQKKVLVEGYSPVKEFYAPDYTQSNTTMGTDARTTLLWVPYIVTDKTNKQVPVSFYTADFTKRIRIVLEGVNDEGRLIHIEKIIE